MLIELYTTASPRKTLNKSLSNKKELTGTLRAQSSVMSPVFTIEDNGSVVGYNYAYIPDFRRYYYIKEITAVRTNLFELALEVDVLKTYNYQIRGNRAIIDRTQAGATANVYIENSTVVNTTQEETATYNFSGGFNDTPEYILITAGGIA